MRGMFRVYVAFLCSSPESQVDMHDTRTEESQWNVQSPGMSWQALTIVAGLNLVFLDTLFCLCCTFNISRLSPACLTRLREEHTGADDHSQAQRHLNPVNLSNSCIRTIIFQTIYLRFQVLYCYHPLILYITIIQRTMYYVIHLYPLITFRTSS